MSENKTHVIDGVTYVEVARKAKVGELVIVYDYNNPYQYDGGKVYPVVAVEGNHARIPSKQGRSVFMREREYRVLEPVAYPRDEVIETLILRIDALEKRLSEAEEGERQLFRLFSRLDDICENLIDKAEDAEADIVLLDERTEGLRKCR